MKTNSGIGELTFEGDGAAVTALCTHPEFGDSENIVKRVLSFYNEGLKLVAPANPVAAELLQTLDSFSRADKWKILLDPVLRSQIGASLLELKRGARVVTDILESTLGTYCVKDSMNLFSYTKPINGRLPLRAYSQSSHDDVLDRSFTALFEQEISDSISTQKTVLCSPTGSDLETLESALSLLDALAPTLTSSLLPHVQVVALVDFADAKQREGGTRFDLTQNVSTHAFPGTIFLSPTPLQSPWKTAEALFHEATHKKLSDIVLTGHVFKTGYHSDTSPPIKALWNRTLTWNSNEWSIDRALFALHFYVHVALFFLEVQRRCASLETRFGSAPWDDPGTIARLSVIKADYLYSQIMDLCAKDMQLGPTGEHLMEWLGNVLSTLSPTTGYRDTRLPLLFERYDRETNELERLIGQIPPSFGTFGSLDRDASYEDWQVGRIVDHLIHSEIVGAHRILSIIGESKPPNFSFYDGDTWSVLAASTISFQARASALTGLRRYVSGVLRGLNENVFSKVGNTRQPKPLTSHFEDTVEHCGRHLEALTNQLRRAKAAGRNHVASFEIEVKDGAGIGLRAWCESASRWHQSLSGFAWNGTGAVHHMLIRGVREDIDLFIEDLIQRFQIEPRNVGIGKSGFAKVPKQMFGVRVRPDNWHETRAYVAAVSGTLGTLRQ